MSKPTNIILIGFMGSGKTSIAKKLKKVSGFDLLDTDKAIIQETQKTISTLFETEGEEAFRDRETTHCKHLQHRTNTIISTGGGTILRAENRALLQKAGWVVYLDTSLAEILKRMANDKVRPLLQVEDRETKIKELKAQREPLYRQTAHFYVDTTGKSVTTIANYIWKQYQHYLGDPHVRRS
ncbi:MAG: shikimate kinase [Candidatus Margulisiibacteriota bacterium]